MNSIYLVIEEREQMLESRARNKLLVKLSGLSNIQCRVST